MGRVSRYTRIEHSTFGTTVRLIDVRGNLLESYLLPRMDDDSAIRLAFKLNALYAHPTFEEACTCHGAVH